MKQPIGFRETTGGERSAGEMLDAVALRVDPSRRLMLRFELALEGEGDEIEALRYARRAMIRRERARGLDWDEPSMEDLTLTGAEIRWFVLASWAAACRQRVGELVDRANRAVAEMRGPRP